MHLKTWAVKLLPLERLLRWYLKHKGKDYLLRFIDGLAHVGRPSSVFFPPELFEQGASLLLSGLNNTLAIQANPQWVWPYWVERQQDPEGDEFVPTGVNLVLGNLTRRNWTSIGIYGSSKEAMVDPVGMVTFEAFGPSVLPFLRINGQTLAPPRLARQAKQSLLGATDPAVVTRFQVRPELEWESVSQALLTEGEELVLISQKLTNRGLKPLELSVGYALRPYNPLTIGHINKIKYKNQLWRVNGQPALYLPREPERSFAASGESSDPLFLTEAAPQAAKLRSKSGLIAGQSEYDLCLAPGETVVLYAAAPFGKHRLGPERGFATLSEAVLEKAAQRSADFWSLQGRKGLNLSLPEPALQQAFGAVKNHLHVFDDGDRFTAGTFFYHFEWLRDSAFLALAFENLGLAKEVRPKLAGMFAKQTKEGFFKSQDGEWDGAGQAMVTIIRHLRRQGDSGQLKVAFNALFKGAQWIEKTRQKSAASPAPHAGLLPAGISAEHFGPNDHYFWDNFWGLAGIKALLEVAQRLGYPSETVWLEEVAETYQTRLEEAMALAISKTPGGGLPCSVYRNLDTAAIGNLVAIWPLDLFSPFEPWVGPTVEFLYQNNLKQGLFYQQIIHTGLNAYLSVQFAQVLLARGDERAWEVIEALLAFGGPTFVWPEAIHPKTHGGCMGDGDHGWAAAEFVDLVRCLLVKEQQGELLLGLGLRSKWIQSEQSVCLSEAPSDHGLVDWELNIYAEQFEFTWKIERGALQAPAPAFLVLPRACVDGPDWGLNKTRIALDGPSGRLSLPRLNPSQAQPQPRTA